MDRLEAIDKKETNIRIVKQTVGIKLIAKTKWPKRLIRITRSLKKDGMNQEKMLDAMSSIRQTLILKGLNVEEEANPDQPLKRYSTAIHKDRK